MANEFYTDMPTKQYASTLDILSQEYSVLFPHVINKGKLTGEEAYFNQLDAFDMTFSRARYASTAFTEPTYGRRRVTPTNANVAIPLDSIDTVKTLVDPRSDLSRQGIVAAGRAKDKILWNALFGTAYTGKAGGTGVGFDANQIVGVQVGGSSANVGLNVAKLAAAIKTIENNSVNIEDPMNELVLFISPNQKADWLQIATLTNSDYMVNKMLATGKLDGVMGISKVIVTNMVPYVNTAGTGASVDLTTGWATGGKANDVDSTSHRACTLMAKSALAFGVWEDVQVKAQERPDLNNIWQLWMQLQLGAARLEEGKVAMIACQE